MEAFLPLFDGGGGLDLKFRCYITSKTEEGGESRSRISSVECKKGKGEEKRN